MDALEGVATTEGEGVPTGQFQILQYDFDQQTRLQWFADELNSATDNSDTMICTRLGCTER